MTYVNEGTVNRADNAICSLTNCVQAVAEKPPERLVDEGSAQTVTACRTAFLVKPGDRVP
jgi:hypothetical protein